MSFATHDSQNRCPDSRPAVDQPAAVASCSSDVAGSLRTGVILFLMLALSAILCVAAVGQQPNYEEITLPEAFDDESLVRRMDMAARSFAGRGSAETNVAKYYFMNYVPAKMTQRASLTEMSELVDNASSLLVRAQRSGNPRANQILQWLFSGMKKVAEGNYYPPAKINAVLVLSRLDERAFDQLNQTPPVPLRYSLPILIAQYNDPANVDGVRAAALKGIHRHVAFSLPRFSDEDKATIKTAMNDLLSSDPPAGRSEQAHAFLQRYAVDILDLMRPKDDAALGEQLISISTEINKPDLIALHSMARLGRMSQEMQGKVAEPADVLGSWAARVLKAFESELARLQALERPVPARQQPPSPEDFLDQTGSTTRRPGPGMMDDDMGMMEEMMEMGGTGMMEMEEEDMMGDMMMMGMGLSGGMLGPKANPQPPEVIASRRKINHVLELIHLGVTGSPAAGMPRRPGGMLAMVSDEKKPEVEAWVTEMQAVVEAINDLTLDKQDKYMEALEAQVEVLREMVGEDPDAAAANEVDDLLNNPNLLNGPAAEQPAGDPGAAPTPDAADALLEEMVAP